ncbi:acyltransferase family protein [Brucella anthropi]|uniref:acyltransferase family protein n=1 Tax=Brucella anthropi TaxID=529 RepID=UPI000CFA9310|nr:acyltransferase [Ochrobactrum sp. MYb49]PQZ63132.1 hypothetical protein CQ057_17100 [Ochrobactrum sp. MYb49]
MSVGGSHRINGLDGLRTVAVMTVFAHHTGLVPMHGGFIGVDIFFVLSGFLITSILVKERDTSRTISLIRFYFRRSARLLPALLFMLLGVTVYIALFRPPIDMKWEVLPSLLYVMNWIRAFRIYDAPLTGHTWSLAIEEQFYIVWPIIILMIWRFQMIRPLYAVVFITVVLISWRALLIWNGASSARVYTGLDTHADGLLIGAALALTDRSTAHKIGKALWAPAAIYLTYILFSKPGSAFASHGIGFTFTALAAAVIIAKIVTAQGSFLTRILEISPIRWLGRISYGFYLWHYPVIKVLLYSGYPAFGYFFGTSLFPKTLMFMACFLASLLLTAISWYIIEQPILRKAHSVKFPLKAATA